MTSLLTLDEVADRLRVSTRTVRREIAAGHLRVVHIRRRPLVEERELDAYVAAQRRVA